MCKVWYVFEGMPDQGGKEELIFLLLHTLPCVCPQAYYRSYIRSQSEWEYAGIYSDEKSGLKAKNRPGFCAMVEDALAEKIDLILVKSVSRLSRNVVDCIDVAKTLGSHGVGIYFEKEGILSTDPTSGMILNLMAAVAQDESRSISDNVKWANRERVKRGEYCLGNNRVLGYDDVEGKLIPNADADIIRTIFRLFLEGKSYRQIAAHLKNIGATGLRGADIQPAGIQYILRNEVYVGDRLLQKRAPRNLLTKQPEKNVEYESNYLQNDHEGIIDRESWKAVQEILDRRASQAASGIHYVCMVYEKCRDYNNQLIELQYKQFNKCVKLMVATVFLLLVSALYRCLL